MKYRIIKRYSEIAQENVFELQKRVFGFWKVDENRYTLSDAVNGIREKAKQRIEMYTLRSYNGKDKAKRTNDSRFMWNSSNV